MPQQLPRIVGIQRIQKSGRLHAEVVRNLQNIADSEDKSFSYVIAEIVYNFFGLKVEGNVVKITRARRKAAIAKRNRAASGRNVRRVAR